MIAFENGKDVSEKRTNEFNARFPKTYYMFLPRQDGTFFQSAHTLDGPKTMSYLMDILRNDTEGTYQGVMFLNSNPEFDISDAFLERIGLTRKEFDDLVKEVSESEETPK